MDTKLKQRVTGAIVLTALAIIVLPMLLDGSEDERARVVASIPEPPAVELDTLTMAEIEHGIKRLDREGAAKAPRVAVDTTNHVTEPAPSATVSAGDSISSPPPALDENELPVSWSLQLASFRSEENAIKLRQALRDADFHTYIIQADTEEGDWYRVYVGPMVSRGRLDEIGAKIEAQFDLKGRIVRYEVGDDTRQLGG